MDRTTNRSVSGNFFTRSVRQKIAEIAPRRIKRLFYMGSLINLMLGTSKPDLCVLAQINKAFKLAYSTAGMMLPVYIGHRHWFESDLENIELTHWRCSIHAVLGLPMTEADRWKSARFLAKRCPDWLCYGSLDLLTSDTHDLIRFLQKQNEA